MAKPEETRPSALGDRERDAISKIGASKMFAAGETIFHEGDPSDSLVLIENGTAAVTRFAASGKDLILTFLNAGDITGEIGCLSGAERSATVVANSDVRAKIASRGAILDAMRKDPELALAFIGVLCARLTETDALVMSLSALKMRARLAGALLQLAKRHGQDDKDGVRIDIQLTQRDVGAFAGLSRENVSRIIAEWRAARILSSEPGGKVLLRDLERLQDIADSEL